MVDVGLHRHLLRATPTCPGIMVGGCCGALHGERGDYGCDAHAPRLTGRPNLHHVAVVSALAAVVAADASGEQLLVTLREMLMAEACPRQQPSEFDLHASGRGVYGA